MSTDQAGTTEATEPKKRTPRSRQAKVRKHRVTTVEKQKIAAVLDALHVEGQEIAFIVSSSDIRGFEVVSFKEE